MEEIIKTLLAMEKKLLPLIKDKATAIDVSISFNELINFVRSLPEGNNATNK